MNRVKSGDGISFAFERFGEVPRTDISAFSKARNTSCHPNYSRPC